MTALISRLLRSRTVSAGPYTFLVQTKYTAIAGGGPHISFGLVQEHGQDVRGDAVVSFHAYPERDRIMVKSQRPWMMDQAKALKVPPGAEAELLTAILRVCATDMESIRLTPKLPLHIVEAHARMLQDLRDRA